MKNKKLKFGVILLLLLFVTGVKAQSVYVNESNGTQSGYALKEIKSMHFTSGNLNVVTMENVSNSFALNALDNLTFTEETINVEEPEQVQSQPLNVYPNPANNVLNIDLTALDAVKEGQVDILNMEGQVVTSKKVNHKGIATLNVANLPSGIYFCRYGNLKETKTVKFIKK